MAPHLAGGDERALHRPGRGRLLGSSRALTRRIPGAPHRLLVVHGHFYQPPREDPWFEEIEGEPSAAPDPDWNTRIQAQCYRPCAHARILLGSAIRRISNAYEHLSFNFGPTLLSWMHRHDPQTYARILAADRASMTARGHGNAIAQAYNHMILPLADDLDRMTQIRWGLADFRHRFGRGAEAMWLPETAVCDETASALAEAGMKYLIVAPHQIAAVRAHGRWAPNEAGEIPTHRPYWIKTVKGRIAAFAYHGPIAADVSFGHLLRSADGFARRIEEASPRSTAPGEAPPLVHFATDGEIYGHHEPFGEMCLAYAAEEIFPSRGIRLTNYAAYLEAHPPETEARLVGGEGSSWSCTHGVGRWCRDCGCATGGEPGWSQAWRAPLREGLDALRDALRKVFVRHGARVFRVDPWEARDGYVDALLAPDPVAGRLEYSLRVLRDPDDPAARETAFRILESQRCAMLMYTSCGWFFHDLAGIETIQLLRYAHRALRVLGDLAPTTAEATLLGHLRRAKSNRPGEGTGASLWRRRVLPGEASPFRAAHSYLCVHGAVAPRRGGLPKRPGNPARLPVGSDGYEFRILEEAGGEKHAVGRIRVHDTRTFEERNFLYLRTGVGPAEGETRLYPEPPARASGGSIARSRHLALARRSPVEAIAEVAHRRGLRTFGPRDVFAPLGRMILTHGIFRARATFEPDLAALAETIEPIRRAARAFAIEGKSPDLDRRVWGAALTAAWGTALLEGDDRAAARWAHRAKESDIPLEPGCIASRVDARLAAAMEDHLAGPDAARAAEEILVWMERVDRFGIPIERTRLQERIFEGIERIRRAEGSDGQAPGSSRAFLGAARRIGFFVDEDLARLGRAG